jgi:hypothetical protein
MVAKLPFIYGVLKRLRVRDTQMYYIVCLMFPLMLLALETHTRCTALYEGGKCYDAKI